MKKVVIALLILTVVSFSACRVSEIQEPIDNNHVNDSSIGENKVNPDTNIEAEYMSEIIDTNIDLIGNPYEIQIQKLSGKLKPLSDADVMKETIINAMPEHLEEYKSAYEENQIIAKLLYKDLRTVEIKLSDGSISVSFDSIEISKDGMLFLMPQGVSLGRIEHGEEIQE